MDLWTEQESNPAFTRKDIRRIRHPKERGIYALAVLINIIALLIVFSWLADELTVFYEGLQTVAQEQNTTMEELDPSVLKEALEDAWYDPKNQGKINLLGTAFALILFTVLVLEYFYASVRARAVRITSEQFGDLYQMASDYAEILGLKKVPEVYLVQENGVLNAFASNIIRKRYIQINIDLLEIAYRQHQDLASIGFVLAHEMAHIKLRHVSVWIRYTVILSQLFPVIGPLLSRVREYSCDRLAQRVSGSDGMEALMALTMGKHLYKKTNIGDYLDSSKEIKGFWAWLVNFSASHPVLPKRMRALANPDIPGKLF